MSDVLKKLKEEKEKSSKYRLKQLKGKAEDMEIQLEEARRKEQQVKAEMSETAKTALTFITKDLSYAIHDEEQGIARYEHYIQIYGNVGWRNTFERILQDERRHLEMLKIAKKAAEDELHKYI